MSCTFKITKTNIIDGLKEASKKHGVSMTAYRSFIFNSMDEDSNFTDDFKEKLSNKFGLPFEELETDKLDDVIKFITDEYNRVIDKNINYSADNESSYPEVAKFGYDSIYSRDFAKKISLNLILSYKRVIESKYGSINKYIEDIKENTGKKLTKFEAYTELLKNRIINSIINRAKERNISTKEEILQLIKTNNIAALEEIFSKEYSEDTNLLALYKEFISDRNKLMSEILRPDRELRKVIYEKEDLNQLEEFDDTESANEEEDSNKSTNEEDPVDNYITNLTHKLGDVGNYMSNIDTDIRIYFSTIPRLVSTEKKDNKYQYDTNNPLGIPDVMDATQCINVILSYAEAYNVKDLIDEIRRITKELPEMQGLVQVADYMEEHKDFAYKLWCNFSQTIMTKIETTNKSGSFQAAITNTSANREQVLKFQFINSFKHSSITASLNDINDSISEINAIKTAINNNNQLLKTVRSQEKKDKYNNANEELIRKLVPILHNAFKHFFNTIQKPAIELYIEKSENKLEAIDFLIGNLNTLISESVKAQSNYAVLTTKIYNKSEEKSKLNNDIKVYREVLEDPSANRSEIKKKIRDIQKQIDSINEEIKELYKKDYITSDFSRLISPFTKALSRYSLVKTNLNSRNVHGNLSSDVLHNNLLTNLKKTLENPTALANYGKYIAQTRQFDNSNIMIEHRDENNNIINYGLFTQDPVTKKLTPTPYASRLLQEALYSGISDTKISEGVLYKKMSEPDYITSAIFNFFFNERNDEEANADDGGPATFANYFMRIPSDAPKNFMIRAPRYNINPTSANKGLFDKGKVNTDHPIYKQMRQVIVQELLDAANAIRVIFKDTNLDGSIDISSENLETGAEKTRLRRLAKNYHYKGKNLFERDKDGKLRLTGNVFKSDKFTLIKYDEKTGKNNHINYGQAIFDEAFDFFYGGANSLKSNNGDHGIELVLDENGKFSPEQEAIIEKHLSQFIIDYSEQCYQRAIENKQYFGEHSFSKVDLTEFALNYFVTYCYFNDLFEGDTKFYKSSQDTLKRFKETQGSGISYGLLDYVADLMKDSTPVEDSALNDTTFIKKTVNEDGSINEEEVKIEQQSRFKAVTIENTVRTGDSIGTFKLRKDNKPARFIKDENGELVEDNNGNYIFEKPGRLSERFIKVCMNDGMTREQAEIHVANIMEGYTDTTVNDAQSYITFEEWVRRIAARGQLEEYKPIIDAILDESKPLDAKTIGKFVQVQKNFYYDLHYNSDLQIIMPRQIKNAEFVLVPRLIEGTQLKEVYKMMEKAGVDQLNTEETTKAGKSNVLTIWDNNGDITEEAKRDFATNAAGAAELFNYNYLYTQQETPSHLASKNKAGIQFMKKIIDNINPKLPNKENNPLWPLKQQFINDYVENIISSAEDFADEFGITIDEDGNFVIDDEHPIDTSLVYKLLEDEMSRQGLDSNSLDYVILGEDGLPNMRACMGNFINKLENIVQGLINNRITRQTLPGFHAAQITNIGFKPLNEFVQKRSYSKELKYHPDEYAIKDKNTGEIIKKISEREYNEIEDEAKKDQYENIGASSYIEIMLPKSNFNFNRLKEDRTPKTDKELLEELRKSGADTIIGYRIPTEGKQSMAIMKVVGFIDDAYDSTIVVPDDWVAQTGSDFDIDSVYGIVYTTELDKSGKLILAKSKEAKPEQYIKYIKNKLERILKQKGVDTNVAAELDERIKEYSNENSEKYKTLKDNADDIFKTMKYQLQNKVKEYNKVVAKGKTKQEKYINKLVHVIKKINEDVKSNDSLSKKEKVALNLYNKKLKEIYSFLKSQKSDFLDALQENRTKLNEEKANELSELAVKAKLPSYARFKERRTRAINRDVRNNRILSTAIEILGHDLSLEENLSRSKFTNLTDSRDSLQSKEVKEIRAKRSPYNFFDQAAYQGDVVSGMTLKGASVARDTFVSVCNTVHPYLPEFSRIKVKYKAKDGYNLKKLQAIFPNVYEDENGDFIVVHNTLGWTLNNKNVEDALLTPYTSETTAHTLDFVKEGPIPNVNNYTFNVYKTFSDIGCSYKLSVAFMMQPVVSKIVAKNNRNNSLFATNTENNPIKEVIVDIANQLVTKKKKYTVFSKLSDIIDDIEKEYSLESLERDITLDVDELVDRLNNNTKSNTEALLHDFKIALKYRELDKLGKKIGDISRLITPDKFGAKQSIFETLDTIRKIDRIKRKFDSVSDMYVIDENGNKISILSAIYTNNISDSAYPTLNAFYQYSTILSVNLGRLLFKDIHNEDFDTYLLSLDDYISKTLNNETYNSFRSYVLNSIYENTTAIKNIPNIDENGNITFNEVIMDEDGNIISSNADDARKEYKRIYGFNRNPFLIVRNEEGKQIEFSVEDINHPTVTELKQYITLSPAQKVKFIKDNFDKQGIFEFIEESLSNRGKLGGKQTLTYNENAVDIETVYSEFEKAFFNSNSLIRLAAIDLIKYAYVVEGFKMKKGAVNKIIKNNAIYFEESKGGLNIAQEVYNQLDRFTDVNQYEHRDELILNFVRSHSNLITNRKMGYHKTGKFYDKEKTKPIKIADLIPTSQGIIIVKDAQLLNRYKITKTINDEIYFNKFIRITDNNITTLYKIHKVDDYAILTPLNLLEENEHQEMSINGENNIYQRPSWYQAVINDYRDRLREQIESLEALEKQNEEEEKEENPLAKERLLISSSISSLLAQADLNKYKEKNTTTGKFAKNFDINSKDTSYTSGFEDVIDKVIERFDSEQGKILYLRSPALTNFIFAPKLSHGSTQVINGRTYLIQKYNTFKANKKYIKEKKEVREVNADLREIFKNAQVENEKNGTENVVNDVFVITESNTRYSSTNELEIDDSNNTEVDKEVSDENGYYSSTEELNTVPDINRFNHHAIQIMRYRRSSIQDPRAISSLDYIYGKDFKQNPHYLEENKKLITKINTDYIVASVNDILNRLEHFKVGDKYYKIDSDEVIQAIKTNPELKAEFLKLILDARAFATNFAIIDAIDITSEDVEIARWLQDVKNVIGKLRSFNIISNAEIRFGNEVLAKLSNNHLTQKDILGVFDGYHTASLVDAWINDLQETSNPLLQIVSSQVMKDLHKKEMLAKREIIAFRKAIAEIKHRAAKAGVTINWDHILDDEGKFIQEYNQAFLNKLQELRDKKEKAKLEIDTNPKAYYKAKIEFDKWKAENLHQEAQKEYYIQLAKIDEDMFKNYPTIYTKYRTLLNRQRELLNLISNGFASEDHLKELKQIKIDINNLTSDEVSIGGELIPKTSYDDPNSPFTGELKILYDLDAAYALRNYKHKKSELEEEYFEDKTKLNFEQELERNLRIINAREKRTPSGKLLTPISELVLDPDYVAAKEWIDNNTFLSNKSEIRTKLREAFSALNNGRRKSNYVTHYAKLRDAFDRHGTINARLLTDEDIAEIKKRQSIEYEVNETNPFSDRTLISNAPDDDVVFLKAFYDNMRSNGASNPEYIAVISKVNDILRNHYDPSTKTVRTSELTKDELIQLKEYYKQLNDIKKNVEGTSTNGKSIFKFIKKHVEFVYNWTAYNEEERRARDIASRMEYDEGQKYLNEWRNANSEVIEDENGNDVLVPNHYLYGYAIPKGYKKGEEHLYIDKGKTEALRYIKENTSNVETEYYYQTYREMKAKSDEEFQKWFDDNHIYNPYTHRIEPLKCWTTLEIKGEDKKEEYLPKFNYRERKVKDDKCNTNYIEKGSYAQNYNGENNEYNNPIKQNEYEKEISDIFKEKIEKYAITEQAKNFFKKGYAPIRQKSNEELTVKKVGKEFLKLLGWINNSTGKEEWIEDENVDYSKDVTLDMPMTTLLKSKDTIDIKHNVPRKQDDETTEEYNERYNKWKEERDEAIRKNKEIHKKLLDKDWVSVMEEFIIKGSKFNAIQDNKYLLFYAKNMIDKQQVYIKNFGFNKLKKTGRKTIDDNVEYAHKIDDNQRGQYVNWLRKVLYEQYKKPNNRVTRIANTMQSITSAKYMMLNFGGGIANVTQGWTQIMGERFARDYFGTKNWYYGVARWNKSIGSFIYDMYKDKATSLESAIVKMFNIVDFTEINGLVEVKNFSKYVDRMRDIGFSTLSVGEHFMQNSALFAMLHSHRLFYEPDATKDGKLAYTYKSLGQAKNEAMDIAFKELIKGTKYEQMYEEFVKYETSKPDYKKEYIWFRKDFTSQFVHIYMKNKVKEFNKLKKKIEDEIIKEFNDDSQHPTLISQLDLDKDGYLKFKDDSWLAIKMSENNAMEILSGFKGRVISVNKKIHGNYDKLSAARLENKWAGALIMQYHKHLYPGIMKRWRRQGYFNEERGSVEKGSNIALLDFIAMPLQEHSYRKRLQADTNMTDSQLQAVEGFQNICKSYLDFFMHFNIYFHMLPRYEQGNILRGLADFVGVAVSVSTAISLQILGAGDDDSFLYNMLINQCDRLATESMSMRSIGIVGEGKKLWSSPIAAQNMVEDLGQLLSLCCQAMFNGDEFEPEYTSGIYKGENKFTMLLKRNTPLYHSIYMLQRLNKNNKTYKLEENMLSIIPVKKIAEYIRN